MKTTTIATLVLLLSGAGCMKQGSAAVRTGPPAPDIGLHAAALQGNVTAVRQHIAAGSDLNATNIYGATPLIVAAAFGRTGAAQALIQGGADLNLRNQEGSTALITAAFFCHPEIVTALLEHGADQTLRNDGGATALDSVTAPFDEVKGVYDQLGSTLRPFGLRLDYQHIRATRPKIAEILRARSPQGQSAAGAHAEGVAPTS